MNILVTGSLGVIGSKLCEELENNGHNVFGLDLFHTNKEYGHGLGKKKNDNYFRCDISEYRQLKYIVDYVKPDVVYNCAAEFGRWNGEYFYEKVWKSNAIGLKNVIRLQEEIGFKLIHCSSSEVYGDYKDIMYEDVLNKTPIVQLNDYAMSKRVNEMQIKNSIEMYKTQTVIVRFFNTYGPGEWYHPFRSVNCVFCYNLLHGKPITVFTGHQRTSTYIWDAIKTLAKICDNFKSGEIYNIASKEEHTIEKLADLVLEFTKADPSLVNIVNENEILTTKFKHVNADKIKKDFNYEDSTSLRDGVKSTVEWMKSYYNL